MAFRIGLKPAARRRKHEMLANAGHDILQGTPLRRVIEHVADRDQRHARFAGDRGKPGEAARIIAAIQHAGAKPYGTGRGFAEMAQQGDQVLVGIGGIPPRLRGGWPARSAGRVGSRPGDTHGVVKIWRSPTPPGPRPGPRATLPEAGEGFSVTFARVGAAGGQLRMGFR